MKKILLAALCLLVVLAWCIPETAFAHPGRTDGNGGHTDHSTGEYHYHHGYPAHDHWDMNNDGRLDCPYLFDNKTSSNNSNSNSTTSKNNATSSTVPKTESKKDTDDSKPLHEQILEASVLIGVIGFIAYELIHKK
jgi:hypothetical protein